MERSPAIVSVKDKQKMRSFFHNWRILLCSVLQGAHGLKGNEGPHGPPGPAVSTIYTLHTLIVFCFLNKCLVPGSERTLMSAMFYLTIILLSGDILGFSWWAWSCRPSWTYRSSWTPWTSRTSRPSRGERGTSKKLTLERLSRISDGGWLTIRDVLCQSIK